MAYSKEQITREIAFSKIVLKNTIMNSNNPTMVVNARRVLNDPDMLYRFALNRLKRKYPIKKASKFESFKGWIKNKIPFKKK